MILLWSPFAHPDFAAFLRVAHDDLNGRCAPRWRSRDGAGLGFAHDDTRTDLAVVCCKEQRPGRVAPFLEEATALGQRVLSEPRTTVSALPRLAQCAVEGMVGELGPDHSDAQIVLDIVLDLYEGWGRPEAARRWRRRGTTTGAEDATSPD